MTQIKPEQIRWRVGQISKRDDHKGMLLGYIDSRTAMEFLDELDPEWSDSYRLVAIGADNGIECSLTVKGITRTDVGVPSNTEGLKGAYSDALKRAAVKHGIGRELYELPRIWVALDDYKRPLSEPAFVKGRWTLPEGTGSVFYDHEPTDTPRSPDAVKPAAGGAKASPPPSPVAGHEDVSAMFDESDLEAGLALLDAAVGTAIGELVPGQPCPEHGDLVVDGKYGPYCPNRAYKESYGKFHSVKKAA